MNQILPFITILCGSTIAVAAEPISFVEHVQPLLVAKCVSCHGPEKQEGGITGRPVQSIDALFQLIRLSDNML